MEFFKVIEQIGVERISFASVPNKITLDPYLPFNPLVKKKLYENTLDPMHESFISAVKEGRGSKIEHIPPETLFSGDFWTGRDAQGLGLIDDIQATPLVMEKMKRDLQVEDYKRLNNKPLSIRNLLLATGFENSTSELSPTSPRFQ